MSLSTVFFMVLTWAAHREIKLESEVLSAKKQKLTTPSRQTTLTAVAGSSKTPVPAAASSSATAKADAKTIKTRSKSLFDQCVAPLFYLQNLD